MFDILIKPIHVIHIIYAHDHAKSKTYIDNRKNLLFLIRKKNMICKILILKIIFNVL